jgi:methylated-DNA-[protein]-cysteine S-methyltransferase
MESSETQKQAIETLPADTTNTLPIFAEVRQWLDDYFAGKRPCNVPRLNPPGTDFQRRVWQRLFTIFYGQTKTYGEIARMVGCKSARAVGQAIGRNL